jgi:hypothetical protein
VSHGFTSDGRYDDTWLFNVQTGRWSDVSPAIGDRPEQRVPLGLLDEGVENLGAGRLKAVGSRFAGCRSIAVKRGL